MQALAAARKAGVTVAIEGESLALEHEGAIPDSIIAGLKQHKAEILSLLRPGESVTPALVCRQEPPFGSSGASSQINTAAARHVARIAEKEAELARQGLGPDGVTPLDEYRRLAAEGAAAWRDVSPLPGIDIPALPSLPSAPWPEPKIRKEPPFGSDKVPSRYESDWWQLLEKCPPCATEQQWAATISGCRD